MGEFTQQYPSRASRPISVREGTKLRDDATLEKHEGGYRAATWSSVLNSFLNWYNEYRNAHLKFVDPDGEYVRAQMPNSHQPRYGDKYYAKLKALERQMVREYEDLHVAMLTLTGSAENANGGFRCPADHLRDVIDTWRPDRGRGVYHTLRDVLGDYDWEYAIVTEKHQSCYGHVHVAVFVDGEVSERDFHSVIDHHLRECDIAHRSAHDYYAEERKTRPISVRAVNPDIDPNDLDTDEGELEHIGNLGSYVGEYIGAHGEELFDRSLEELAFRAVCWATGTQMVRFSTGANEMIDSDLTRYDSEEPESATHVTRDHSVDTDEPEPGDGAPFVIHNPPWELAGICRVDQEGETMYDTGRSGVKYKAIEGAEQLDPPKQLPPDRPLPKGSDTSLSDY